MEFEKTIKVLRETMDSDDTFEEKTLYFCSIHLGTENVGVSILEKGLASFNPAHEKAPEE